MALARWDPFADFVPLRDAMARLFESSFITPGLIGGGIASAVPMDVYAEGDNYVVEAALPGLNPEALNVSVLGNEVTISGEYPQIPESRQYLFRERRGGRFERTITLPAALDADKVEAHYEHGLLRLVVPKAESARPRRIALTAGS
ncbi:MAG TPA: Hsp20/alpha crystallin family protein [Chloroflexota bacterium]|nr:Hsp20/alpha crystallin family protein [Chloroflexota bacterium]